MRRKSVFLSPIGLILSVMLFLGLGFSLWKDGAQAFSPGGLSARNRPGLVLAGYPSHAKFEHQCELCHQPLKSIQANLCLNCHTEIAQEAESSSGLHSRFSNLLRCADCHSDHHGRDFDMLSGALQTFDHSLTTFSLIWHQVDYSAAPLECSACHSDSAPGYPALASACTDCHTRHSPDFMSQHILDFGENCLACHDGTDRMVNFDHATTEFLLEGQHRALPCAACHPGGRFAGTPAGCADCHAEPETHRSLFKQDCAACHTSQAWKPATLSGEPFEHAQATGFSLARHAQDYSGGALTCLGCHLNGLESFDLQTCVACHSGHDSVFMTAHTEQFGPKCLECHDGVDRLSNFDHATFFPLEGKHAEADCAACHADKVFRGTPSECVQCHAEPAIHAGSFGVQCQDCHTATAWTPAKLRIHTFPLNHGSSENLACKICHSTTYIEYTCYGCHDHQPEAINEIHTRAGIAPDRIPDCAGCHEDGLR